MPYEMPNPGPPDLYLYTCKDSLGDKLREFKAKTLRQGNTWAIDAYSGPTIGHLGRTGTIFVYAIHVLGGRQYLSLCPCQRYEVFLGKVYTRLSDARTPATDKEFPVMDAEDLEQEKRLKYLKQQDEKEKKKKQLTK